MDLLIATWTLRLAIAAAIGVGAMSVYVGTPVLDAVDRALAAAFGFSLAGRWFAGLMEPPERRLLRMRRQREKRRAKRTDTGGKKAGSGGKKAAPATTTTISRTA